MSTIKKLINLYQKNKEIVRNESESYFLQHIKELKVHIDLFHRTKLCIKHEQEIIEFIHKKTKKKYIATHVSSIHWFEDNEQVKISNDNIKKLLEVQQMITKQLIEDIENLRIDAKMQLKFKKEDSEFPLLIQQEETMKKWMNNWRQWQWQKKHSNGQILPESVWTYAKKQYKKLCLELMTKLGRMYDLKSYVRLNYAEYFNVLY